MYAEKTSVSVAKSKTDIEKTINRYGADSYAYGCEGPRATVGFRLEGKYVRFNMTLPDRGAFTKTPTGKARSAAGADKEWEQACRSRWRALNLVIKAMLEAVETGIVTFEEAFLAHIMLPDGGTVGDTLLPQLEASYRDGKTMPSLLPYGGS